MAILGSLSAWKHHNTRAEVLFVLSALLLIAAMSSRRFRRRFHQGWTRVAETIAMVNSTIILGIVFWVGFGFYRCWGRVLGRDPLGRRANRQESYWIPRQRTRQQPWQFERLY